MPSHPKSGPCSIHLNFFNISAACFLINVKSSDLPLSSEKDSTKTLTPPLLKFFFGEVGFAKIPKAPPRKGDLCVVKSPAGVVIPPEGGLGEELTPLFKALVGECLRD
eukprot:TRINITY_DN31150_c0_g1_i4.p2 TRINITY_DN31150_c0_g1~~TRINITY_DN31150_c0_g1_i4.p2  ORF type:complete len:108 (-),score=19.47 TRINITY_DN31150_c0_g1_i4:315-638(-)